MRALRRFFVVAVLAALVGAVVRLVSSRGAPPHPAPSARGGWRELQGPDFR